MGISQDEFTALINSAQTNLTIVDAFAKCESEIRHHDKIMASVSGGWDSDIMLDMIVRCGGAGKTEFVFFNTGLEYDATKKHIKELQQKYGIEINDVKPVKPIPLCVKDHGVPFWSKRVSEMIERLQRHNFQWEDEPLAQLLEKYPKCRASLRWWCNDFGEDGKITPYDIDYVRHMKEFLIANPPDFPISQKCCYYAKKLPAKNFAKTADYDLNCTGIRKYEGGARSMAYKACFTSGTDGTDQYRPLFWFTDDDKKKYTDMYGIEPSDCYTVWKLPRTGCSCCPFARNYEDELDAVKKYEPKFYNAAIKIFGRSYEYRRKFERFREEKRRQNNGEKETSQRTQTVLPL